MFKILLAYFINSYLYLKLLIADGDLNRYIYGDEDHVKFEPISDFIFNYLNPEIKLPLIYILSTFIFFKISLYIKKHGTNSQLMLFLFGLSPVLFSALLRQFYALYIYLCYLQYRHSIIQYFIPLFHYGSVPLLIKNWLNINKFYFLNILLLLIAIILYTSADNFIIENESFVFLLLKLNYYLNNEISFFKPYLFVTISLLISIKISTKKESVNLLSALILITTLTFFIDSISERFLLLSTTLVIFINKKDIINLRVFNYSCLFILLLRLYQNSLAFSSVVL